jgi:glutaredoxin
MNVILYSTHCPKCNVLETKLKQKNIQYEEVNDTEIMTQKGFTAVPMLEVNGIIMDYKQAVEWVNERED